MREACGRRISLKGADEQYRFALSMDARSIQDRLHVDSFVARLFARSASLLRLRHAWSDSDLVTGRGNNRRRAPACRARHRKLDATYALPKAVAAWCYAQRLVYFRTTNFAEDRAKAITLARRRPCAGTIPIRSY